MTMKKQGMLTAVALVLALGLTPRGWSGSLEADAVAAGKHFDLTGELNPGTPVLQTLEEAGGATDDARAFLKGSTLGKQPPLGLTPPEVPTPQEEPVSASDAYDKRVNNGIKAGLITGTVITALMYLLAGPMAISLLNVLAVSGFLGGALGTVFSEEDRWYAIALSSALALLLADSGSLAAAAVLGGPIAAVAMVLAAAVAARVTSEIDRGRYTSRNLGEIITDVIGCGVLGIGIGITAPILGGALLGKWSEVFRGLYKDIREMVGSPR